MRGSASSQLRRCRRTLLKVDLQQLAALPGPGRAACARALPPVPSPLPAAGSLPSQLKGAAESPEQGIS